MKLFQVAISTLILASLTESSKHQVLFQIFPSANKEMIGFSKLWTQTKNNTAPTGFKCSSNMIIFNDSFTSTIAESLAYDKVTEEEVDRQITTYGGIALYIEGARLRIKRRIDFDFQLVKVNDETSETITKQGLDCRTVDLPITENDFFLFIPRSYIPASHIKDINKGAIDPMSRRLTEVVTKSTGPHVGYLGFRIGTLKPSLAQTNSRQITTSLLAQEWFLADGSFNVNITSISVSKSYHFVLPGIPSKLVSGFNIRARYSRFGINITPYYIVISSQLVKTSRGSDIQSAPNEIVINLDDAELKIKYNGVLPFQIVLKPSKQEKVLISTSATMSLTHNQDMSFTIIPATRVGTTDHLNLHESSLCGGNWDLLEWLRLGILRGQPLSFTIHRPNNNKDGETASANGQSLST